MIPVLCAAVPQERFPADISIDHFDSRKEGWFISYFCENPCENNLFLITLILPDFPSDHSDLHVNAFNLGSLFTGLEIPKSLHVY